MKKTYIVHPFIFALFPILFLFFENVDQTSFSEIFLPLVLTLSLTILLTVLTRFIIHNSEKAGILVSIILVFFFFYGHAYNVVQDWQIGSIFIGRLRYLLLVWILLFAICAYFVFKIKTNLQNFTKFLNIISLILIFFSLFHIFLYEFKSKTYFNKIYENKEDKNAYYSYYTDATIKRDIYYIILDGYASSSTLEEIYGYNNHEFIDYLSKKNFFIASKSKSNYATTFLSLASSLNMKYVNYLTDIIGVKSKDRRLCDKMIRNSEVMNFIKSRGYKFIQFDSGWEATSNNKNANYEIVCRSKLGRLNEFEIVLVKTTILRLFVEYFNLYEIDARERVLCAFSKIAEIHKVEGPKFIFAHILCPHYPFVFGANGEIIPTSQKMKIKTGLEEKEDYLNQLIFVNKKVKILIDEILSKSNIQPIVILQADHGSGSFYSDPESVNHPTESNLNERMRIFNAYYLPTDRFNFLYDSITPVNSFRLILNYYFHANYQLLKDQSYYSTYERPYKFINVTNRLR